MREQIIDLIESVLRLRTRAYVSEGELHLSLYQSFVGIFDEVYFDYRIPPQGRDYSYVDLVLRTGNDFYPIEIKYQPKYRVYINNKVFGREMGRRVSQGGTTQVRQNFWKDIYRMEQIRSLANQPTIVHLGIALFVTNDSYFWNNYPRVNDESALSLHDHSTIGGKEIRFTQNGKEVGFILRNSYSIEWQDLPQLTDINNFRFLIPKPVNPN